VKTPFQREGLKPLPLEVVSANPFRLKGFIKTVPDRNGIENTSGGSDFRKRFPMEMFFEKRWSGKR
jgi:hypothetical protein